MKSIKKIFAVAGSVIMASTFALTAAACDPQTPVDPPDGPVTQTYDPETRKLTMAIGTPDGVFNPFFSTAANDSTIIGMTQISMLSSDELGNITYGDNEPTVVKDYQSYPTDNNTKTTYEFIIKNDIKFSDGEPLTINDVLFNLYVYLDPVYTGSATIYSTDIVGLKEYRTQNPNATDNSMSTFEESFVNDARVRVNDLVEFMQVFGRYTPGPNDPRPSDRWTNDQKAAFKNDFVTVAKTFREELYSDWNSTTGSMESYIKDWEFTDAWQVFLLNDGGITELLQTYAEGEKVGQYVKDDNGNYKLDKVQAAQLKVELDLYLEANGYDGSTEEKSVAEGTKEWAVDYVFSNYFSATDDTKEGKYDESAFGSDKIDATISATVANNFESIVRYWGTASTIRDKFAAEEKSKYFAGQDRVVPTISGIDGTTKRTKDFEGNDLGSEHSVLRITINGIDPKAIWNFAFTVAPMHYYSGTYTNKKGVTKDYVKSFDQSKGEFGLEFGDIDFFNNVINASEKVKLPVGGGVYMAANSNGNATRDGDAFFNLNNIYYVRNPYFNTTGKGIENAKIKYFTYTVVETDQIINRLTTKEIDIGEPNATQDNIRTLNNNDDIAHKEIKTSGYGYVGINPRFVPNINVRRALIKAMDTDSITRDYYQGGLAEIIYRGMSNTSWAYPQGASVYTSKDGKTSYKYDALGDEIEQLVIDAGYTKGSDGVYTKTISGFGEDRLDYKFTIAGSSTDHPAYNMFLNAAKILNNHGFAVKVVTSQTALSDLSTGKLEVWAAAWSSTIDPDMYQVWHMDSQATSTSNWGYKQIKANKTLYATEWSLIQELSTLIDAGRATNKQNERADIYHEALDLVMELAVEMPTYQRKDMTAYNANVIDEKTLQPENKLTAYNGLFSRIWEVNYK